jgi:hypothetical protein
MERRPPDIESTCEYFEQTVAERREKIILQLVGWECDDMGGTCSTNRG